MKIKLLYTSLFISLCSQLCWSQEVVFTDQEKDSIVSTYKDLIVDYFQENHQSETILNLFLNYGKDAYTEVLAEQQITRYNTTDFLNNSYVKSQNLPKLYGVDFLFLHSFVVGSENGNRTYRAKADVYTYWIKAGKLTPQLRNVSVQISPKYYQYLAQQGYTRGYALRLSNIRFYEYDETWDLTQVGDMEVCTRPEALSEYNIPVFKYPFPTYSNVYPMDRDTYFPNCFTWGNVEEKIREALIACSYRKVKYYLLSQDGENLNGFILMTELEEIDEAGNSKEKCKETTQAVSYLSVDRLKQLVLELFNRRPGYYRMLVFAVTDLDIVSNMKEVDKDEILHIQKGGASTFSNRLSNIPFKDTYQVTALIYEFALSKADGSLSVTDARLAGKTHLDNSGVLPNWLD